MNTCYVLSALISSVLSSVQFLFYPSCVSLSHARSARRPPGRDVESTSFRYLLSFSGLSVLKNLLIPRSRENKNNPLKRSTWLLLSSTRLDYLILFCRWWRKLSQRIAVLVLVTNREHTDSVDTPTTRVVNSLYTTKFYQYVMKWYC